MYLRLQLSLSHSSSKISWLILSRACCLTHLRANLFHEYTEFNEDLNTEIYQCLILTEFMSNLFFL